MRVFCLSLVKTLLGDCLGQLYLAKAFTESARAQTKQLIEQIVCAMVDLLSSVDWLDAPTRQKALDKVASVVNLIGGADSFDPMAHNMRATTTPNSFSCRSRKAGDARKRRTNTKSTGSARIHTRRPSGERALINSQAFANAFQCPPDLPTNKCVVSLT
ncbi:hypothetical protein AC1031_007992 [Aphanomyces cochlioides]|nr:hypothetical protein AC1031_007992 [Aphanomyces cochlioides]